MKVSILKKISLCRGHPSHKLIRFPNGNFPQVLHNSTSAERTLNWDAFTGLMGVLYRGGSSPVYSVFDNPFWHTIGSKNYTN